MDERRINVWVQQFTDRPALVLQWLDPTTGRRRSRSTGTSNPQQAERQRADLEYELNHGHYRETSRIDWQRFRQLFENEHLAGCRLKTQEKYGTVFDVFEQIVRPQQLKSITERTLSAFVSGMRERRRPGGKLGLAPMTLRNYLVAIKTALSWAVEQKLISRLPAFPSIKVPKKKPQPVPSEWFDRLLAAAPDERWRTYLLCGWWGGLRLDEARHLRRVPSDEYPWLDLPNNRIVLPAVFAKSAEDQSVPLHRVLREAIEKLPTDGERVFDFRSRKNGDCLSGCGVSQRVRGFAKRAGVPLSMHRLRKGFGCRVAKQLGKGNAPILHELMRHSSMQITMDYYASVDDALQEAMKGLS
ncbi:MAG: tyrosine-type recombinase/integrase [Gemmataceae bacterium]|nr:tyrosine-type recombinase/integrase [Gemmataceae bacterium]